MAKKDKSNGLSKAERKALEQKEAALMAELEARAHKAPDVAGLKRKALKALVADKSNPKPLRKAAKAELARRASDSLPDLEAAEPKAEPTKVAKPKTAKAKTIAAAERVLAEPGSEAALANAETALEAATEADDDETDAQIKARVRAKREARAAAEAKANESVKPKAKATKVTEPGSARNDDAEPGESEVDYQWRKARERDERDAAKPKGKSGKADKAAADDALATAHFEAEEVETETGREFAVGPVSDDVRPPEADAADAAAEFAKPSEAPRDDFETNGNGQYKVKRETDGKIVGYTRVTTFIATNEDRTLLERWKLRILLEGVAINDTPDERGRIDEPVVAKVRDLIHRRDLAIAKARKADRKLKLVPGQYGTIVDAAWAEFKRDLDALAESLLDLGGAHEKAAKGTQLHELFELYDREGIDAVGELAVEGKITHADLADVEAYARAIEAAGIKIIPEYIEAPIVIHDEKIAGRLDRVVMARMPGAARAAKYVLDVKSGRIDLGAGKIAQQLEKYSKGVPYDLDTHETLAPHGASRTKGLVLHLVPGSGVATIHPIDLGTGRVGNDLSAKVRAFRNEGKKAIDLTVDLAKPEASA